MSAGAFSFYFTYTPDYKSPVRAEILRYLNETGANGGSTGSTPLGVPSSNFARDAAGALKLVFEMNTHSIGFGLTGEKWYSRNARKWNVNGGNAFLTDNYFAIPVSGTESTVNLFRRSGPDWIFDQELSPGFPFRILALEAEVLVIGNKAEKHVFRRVDDSWTLEQTIRLDEQQLTEPYFSSDVGFALDDETMAVGWNDSFIELFDRRRGKWVSSQKIDRQFLQLDEPDSVYLADMEGGRLVLVSYDYVTADDYDDIHRIFQVHILKRDGRSWVIEQEITEESFPQIQLADGDRLGDNLSASIHGRNLAVGNSAQNAVYIFKRDAERWVLEETITETDFALKLEKRPSYSEPSFGDGVAIKGDLLVVTESVHAAYVFTRGDDGWRLEAKTLEGNNRFYGGPKITEGGVIFIVDSGHVYAMRRDAAPLND